MHPKRPKFVKLTMAVCSVCKSAVPQVRAFLSNSRPVELRLCPKCDGLSVK